MIKKSYFNYLLDGARSTSKLKDLHGGLADLLEESIIELDVNKSQNSKNGSEHCFQGKYYPKNVDIYSKKKNLELCTSVKFVSSNLKQNENNYFENLIGDVANIKSKNKALGTEQEVFFSYVTIFRHYTPYFEKEDEKNGNIAPKVKKVESLNWDIFEKYNSLAEDSQKSFHSPDFICPIIVVITKKGENELVREIKELEEMESVKGKMREDKRFIDEMKKSLLPETDERVIEVISRYRNVEENNREFIKESFFQELDELIEIDFLPFKENELPNLYKNEQIEVFLEKIKTIFNGKNDEEIFPQERYLR